MAVNGGLCRRLRQRVQDVNQYELNMDIFSPPSDHVRSVLYQRPKVVCFDLWKTFKYPPRFDSSPRRRRNPTWTQVRRN
jgi:hypothetical protein